MGDSESLEIYEIIARSVCEEHKLSDREQGILCSIADQLREEYKTGELREQLELVCKLASNYDAQRADVLLILDNALDRCEDKVGGLASLVEEESNIRVRKVVGGFRTRIDGCLLGDLGRTGRIKYRGDGKQEATPLRFAT